MHLLMSLLVMPAVGAGVVAFLPSDAGRLIRGVALVTTSATLVLACSLLAGFDPALPGPQFLEMHRWNPRLGTSFSLAVDGFSLPMVLLATLLSLIALLASNSIRERVKGYYLLMLLLETAMLGVFMAQDWALFYLFWELTLIPLFFLIDRWGGENRHGAALNFVLYTMGGSVFMLISLLVLFDTVPGHSFAMSDMAAGASELSEHTQILIFLGFPHRLRRQDARVSHPRLASPGPCGGAQPGQHPALRDPAQDGGLRSDPGGRDAPGRGACTAGILATLALVSLLYGGLLAWRQSDLKAMIAYSSVSHMGVVLLGIAALNFAGLSGAVMQMTAHGLVAGALFLLIGLLYERTHTRDVNNYSSLVRVTPRFAFFTTLAFVAAVGLPGTVGFIAELNTLIGGFRALGLGSGPAQPGHHGECGLRHPHRRSAFHRTRACRDACGAGPEARRTPGRKRAVWGHYSTGYISSSDPRAHGGLDYPFQRRLHR